jgi:hypothetical protein
LHFETRPILFCGFTAENTQSILAGSQAPE